MDEEYNPEQESWEEYQRRILGEFIIMNANKCISKYLIHNIKTPKIILFFKNIFLSIKNIFTTIKSKILDFISIHKNTVIIRPAGSMMTLSEAIDKSAKLKNLKQFAEWVYKNWASWDKEFSWYNLDTWCYDDKPDNRIGWRKTYMIIIHYPSRNESHPVAFTNKPFYKLKSNLSDNIEIIHKYPKLLECVGELKTGTRDESKLYQKHILDIL